MATSETVIASRYFVKDIVYVEPGKDIGLSVDATQAFGPGGTLAVEGSAEAAHVTYFLTKCFGRANYLAVLDAHTSGSAHGHDAYTQEAGIIPNVTILSEEKIQEWMIMGEEKILQPHAQFNLRSLLIDARLTLMFSGAYQTVWMQHAVIGGNECLFIPPIEGTLFCNIFYKGPHRTHDSPSGIWDSIGNPVGTMEAIAARPKRVRRIFVDGNALEVCIYLTLLNLSRFGIEVYIVCDGVGYLPFIENRVRNALIENLNKARVKFVHSSQLRFN